MQNLHNYPGKMIIFMALKGTIFGFYGTKSLRKNYNIGKKCIINIGFKVSSKNEKMAKNSKWQNGKIAQLAWKIESFMALKGTIFCFYGTKSLRKNYNIGKK